MLASYPNCTMCLLPAAGLSQQLVDRRVNGWLCAARCNIACCRCPQHCPPTTPAAAAAVWLLHRGANVHAMKQDGWRDTALHYAAGRGSLATVHVLLAWGADAAARNALGELGAGMRVLYCRKIIRPSLLVPAGCAAAASAMLLSIHPPHPTLPTHALQAPLLLRLRRRLGTTASPGTCAVWLLGTRCP